MLVTLERNEPVRTMNPETNEKHIPVMLDEVLEYLAPKAGDCFVDGTLGLGGHSSEILKRIGPTGRLIGMDRDKHALALAKERLNASADQCSFIHGDFRDIDETLTDLNIDQVDGILLDLGVSSFQLNDAERGFSLKYDGPLDMRMDQTSYISAYDLVNSLSEKEIDSIIRDFGQERWHARIAQTLVSERTHYPIKTTRELKRIILRSIPYRRKRGKLHPATRTFQAFRIAVNRELEALNLVLERCMNFIKPKGRIGVIAFHSLEDKIVKEKFKTFAKDDEAELIFKKPLRPSLEEVERNPRSRSARFRVIERK